jgi:hypothetical protein
VDPHTAAEILAGQWRKTALQAFCFLDDVATLTVRDRTDGYRTAEALLELEWSSGPRTVSLSWWPYGKETELRFKAGDAPSVSFHSFDAYFTGKPIHQTLRTSNVMREVLPTWAERARPSLLRFFAEDDTQYDAAVAALP